MNLSKLFLILFLILNINLVLAADFSINSIQQLSQNPYRGDLVNFKGIVQASNDNYCYITCEYSVGTYSGYVSDGGNPPATQLDYGDIQEFPFNVRAEGSSNKIVQELVVVCQRVSNYINCWPGSATHSKTFNFSFLYPGDGICTPLREKCQSFESYIGTTDCTCSSNKECRPNGNRNPDERGCQTYCGNKIYESQYEDCGCASDFTCPITKKCKPNNERALDNNGCSSFCGNGICEREYENCNNCSQDCKNCDFASCTKDSECTGGYCVWNLCWNNPTRKNDGHCDLGEDCISSPNDCACAFNQRCSSNGICETFCGNGICEEDEIGICKADCKWCGDGTCQTTESCSSCSYDCGICKKIEEPENKTMINKIKNNTIIVNNEIIKNETVELNESEPKEPIEEPRIKNQIIIPKTSGETPGKNYFIIMISSLIFKIIISSLIFMILAVIIALIMIYLKKIKKAPEVFTNHYKKFIICRKCNKKIDPDSSFCIYCGNRIR